MLEHQNHVLELIARGAPLDETLTVYLRAIEAQAPDMLSSILLLDDDGLHLRHCAAPTLPAEYVKAIGGKPIGPAAGSCGTAAYLGAPVVVQDIETDPLWVVYKEIALRHGLRACWSTPIFDGRQHVLGTFAMYFRENRFPTAAHRALIDVTTYTAAIAIVQHREREELKAWETQFAEAQHLAQVGSYEWDLSTFKTRRSAELYRIFGLEPHEFEPTFEAYLARVHPDDREHTRAIVEQSLHDLTPFDFEERIVRADGAVRLLRSRGHWVIDPSGRPPKLVGICHDITEKKALKEQLQAIAGRAREPEIQSSLRNLERAIEDLLR